MGILADLFRAPPRGERIEPQFTPPASGAQPRASLENPSVTVSDPAAWWANLAGTGPGWGPPVTERTAMAVTAVFRCVDLLSGLVAGLPLKVYERTPQGRRQATESRLWPLVADSPAPNVAAFQWRELWMVHLLLWGNHYSLIRYDNAGRVVRFEPLLPWNVVVYRQAGRSLYRCTLESGAVEWALPEDMLHLQGPSFDGIIGLSRIQAFGRNAVSMSRLLEEQTARVHENAARPSLAVETPPNISEDGFRRLRAQFEDRHVGRDNAGRPIFLQAGQKVTPLQMTPEDLATLETRRFEVAEISRVFGVPLHLLNETDKSTSWGSGLSEQTAAFLLFTLNKDLNRIQGELNMKLTGRSPYYIEFDRGGLLETDALKSAQAMQTEINAGIRTINEARRLRNLPDVPGGDVPLVNSTLRPLGAAQAEASPDAA